MEVQSDSEVAMRNDHSNEQQSGPCAENPDELNIKCIESEKDSSQSHFDLKETSHQSDTLPLKKCKNSLIIVKNQFSPHPSPQTPDITHLRKPSEANSPLPHTRITEINRILSKRFISHYQMTKSLFH